MTEQKSQLSFAECSKLLGHCWRKPRIGKITCMTVHEDQSREGCVHCGATRERTWTSPKPAQAERGDRAAD